MKHKVFMVIMALSILPLFAGGVAAQESGPSYERGGMLGAGIVAGAKVGGGFSQPFGDLGSSFLTELEVGYVLPALEHSLQLFLSGGYTQPKAEGKGIDDPRLPGPASYTLTQQQAMVTLGVLYRLHLSSDLIRPYAALGPRLYMLRTKISGKAGSSSFGDNEETATKIGAFGALGAELHFGPGAVLCEVSLAWVKLDGYVLRDTSAGALGLALGYRLFL